MRAYTVHAFNIHVLHCSDATNPVWIGPVVFEISTFKGVHPSNIHVHSIIAPQDMSNNTKYV
jgi:cytochrome b involved in lipid metabolism